MFLFPPGAHKPNPTGVPLHNSSHGPNLPRESSTKHPIRLHQLPIQLQLHPRTLHLDRATGPDLQKPRLRWQKPSIALDEGLFGNGVVRPV